MWCVGGIRGQVHPWEGKHRRCFPVLCVHNFLRKSSCFAFLTPIGEKSSFDAVSCFKNLGFAVLRCLAVKAAKSTQSLLNLHNPAFQLPNSSKMLFTQAKCRAFRFTQANRSHRRIMHPFWTSHRQKWLILRIVRICGVLWAYPAIAGLILQREGPNLWHL